MTINGWIQIAAFCAVIILLVKPLGGYMTRVFTGERTLLSPVLGPVEDLPGLLIATGFSGHGFQLGPGVGDVMAELIHTGATSTPIGQYHIGRFAEPVAQAA